MMRVPHTLLAAAAFGILAGATGCGESKPAADPASMSSTDGTAMPAAKHACKGQNACKGQGGCKTEQHACKGQNACKGQGGCKST